MSTRCQIAFITAWTAKDGAQRREERWVYRHWDGYPDAVLPDLQEFIVWNGGRMGDVEYTAANFLFWSRLGALRQELGDADGGFAPATERAAANTFVRQCVDAVVVGDNIGAAHSGFGVCNPGEFHGDIEYFYEVITDEAGTRIVVYEVPATGAVRRECLRRILEVRAPP